MEREDDRKMLTAVLFSCAVMAFTIAMSAALLAPPAETAYEKQEQQDIPLNWSDNELCRDQKEIFCPPPKTPQSRPPHPRR